MLLFFQVIPPPSHFFLFFFNDTATTEIYTLSLHDALPIFRRALAPTLRFPTCPPNLPGRNTKDRKSTRLNSSHQIISYAVFCLKKKKNKIKQSAPGRPPKCDQCHS